MSEINDLQQDIEALTTESMSIGNFARNKLDLLTVM